MSAIKDGRFPIMLDRQRHLLFSLNVIDELQDKAGGYDRLHEFIYPDGVVNFKNLKWLLALLINEGADDGDEVLTEKQIGRLIHNGNLNEVMSAILKAFARGKDGESQPPVVDDEDEDDEKNRKGGRGM